MQMDMQQLPFMTMQNPPPIPGLGPASNPPTQSPFQGAAPTHPFYTLPPNSFPATAQMGRIPHAIQNDRVTDVTESDKEEGEVSDGSRSTAINGRTYPDPPRSIPLPSTRLSDMQDTYHPEQPSAGQASDTTLRYRAPVPARITADNVAQQRSDAKTFIKLLHNNNIGYHALAAEALDASSLRDLYRSLNLPSEPEPVISPPKVNGTTQVDLSNGDSVLARTSPPVTGLKPVTTLNTSVPPAKSAPSPANRKEYLAQLQAAKKARQQGGAKVTPPQNTPPPASAAPKASPTPKFTGASENGQLTEAEKKATTTELIRRRIEALKKNSSSPARAAPSKPSVTSFTAAASSTPLPKVAHPLPPTHNGYTTPAVPSSPYGNIPGLFMNPPTVVQPSHSPVAPGSAKRKLSFPSSVDSHPLRADRNDRVDHTIRIDDNQDAVAMSSTQMTPTQNGSHRVQATPVVTGLPSRPASANPSVSGVSTPGPQTPSGTTRSLEMDDKTKKQAALKERLQKKIEEQKRQAEQKRLASVQNSPRTLPQQASLVPKPSNGQEVYREPKRRRKADIEAEKSALDVEIAENAARLEQITKELESLTANDKKMRRNKERLQVELESLGIDTEGMPHAELQAKKDEIEREQGVALETLTATANLPATSPATKRPAAAAAPMPAQTVFSSGSDSQYPSQPSVSSRGIPGLNASFLLASSPSTTANHGTTEQQNPMPHKAPEPAIQAEQVIPVKHLAVASVHGTVSNNPSKPATPVDDEEDFYSPEPAEILPFADHLGTVSRSTALVRSPSEEGEMAMSESDEEDYEPEEPKEQLMHAPISNDHTLEPSTTVVTAQASSSGSLLVSTPANEDEDEDPYEPPDVDQPMTNIESGAATTEHKSTAQQVEIEEEEMDMSTSSDENSDSDTSSEPSEEEPNRLALALSRKNPGSSVTVADDLAPELQPDASAGASVSQERVVPPVTQEPVSLDAPLYIKLTMRRM
jgi:hypothetical protein